MGWEYLNSDRALARRFRLRMTRFAQGGIPITGCSTQPGRIEEGFNPRRGRDVGSGTHTDIEFQFPPKVLNDSRKGNWYEGDQTGGKEPVAAFKTSGPRTITLAWIYVVDSFANDPSNGWTIERISRQIRTLRGYFALSRGIGAKRDGLAIQFHMWCIGGDKPTTGRIASVDVKYGETLVFPPSLSDRAFPLRTEITVDFRLWSQGKDIKTSLERGEDEPGPALGIGQQDLNALDEYTPPSWF